MRLKEAFEKLGFQEVIELPIYNWKKIDEIDLFCGSVGSMDSFLAIRSDNHTILNLNDCILKEKQYRYIKRKIGKIDFLFTQFSFANWVGNEKDDIGACNKKISDIYLQRKTLNPQYIIPFASFVYFCNKENSRMNEWINTPEKIIQLDIPEINFMYPGDKINSSNIDFKSKKAVENYMNDIVNIETVNIATPPPPSINIEEVTQAIDSNLKKFKKRIWLPFRIFVKPFGIYLHDLNKSILIDPKNGIWSETTKEKSRYEMCSQVCWYTFKYSWGTGTLQVSGMFLDKYFEEQSSKYFFFQNMLSTEFLSTKFFSQILRTLKFIWRKKWEIFYRFIRPGF